ncbi:hypothetical protein ISO99_06895 [Staphylococcus sp. 18_1_E_LY]|uniref:Uncharacterized protein n=1 Tax=Staphylococcus lloydii TaxID=2781774 RepID=A0A7T1AZL7_9STAP|nr:hypothetical protein [Staphylococcus lloydii]MBF7019638.1 hypothetical protein [Staphylococcus lloydii]MBF7027366.1 hypothetical protein [Staphylococcus lloydii]MDU9418999.1 hypothetical protein [Staphylococcus lloydii]QPM75029.1 hypothetical protein ISP08_12030 [Staphylococcus lloydii]
MKNYTVQELEDSLELSRHYDVKVDGDAILKDNKDILEVIELFEAIEDYLVIKPNDFADHEHIEID